MLQYYYLNGGEATGPVTAEALQALAFHRKINHDTKVMMVGSNEWVEARTLSNIRIPLIGFLGIKVHALVGALALGPGCFCLIWLYVVGMSPMIIGAWGIDPPSPESVRAWQLWGVVVGGGIATLVWPAAVFRSVNKTLKMLSTDK
jgi:hypothetical protein